MIDGHERCVYRIKESDQLPNRRDPFVLVASKLKLTKCNLLCKSVHYLSQIISGEEVAPNPTSVEAIRNFVRPRTLVELQSFLGLASY